MFEALVYHSYKQYIKFIKFNILRRRFYILIAPAAVLLIISAVLFAAGNGNAVYLALCALAVPFAVFSFVLKSAGRRFEKDENYVKISTNFLFSEDFVMLTNFLGSKKKVTKIAYGDIYALYETKDCFYMYMDRVSAYYIPKKDISRGSAQELGAFLKSKLGSKFKGKN